jgi:hypothetical protein
MHAFSTANTFHEKGNIFYKKYMEEKRDLTSKSSLAWWQAEASQSGGCRSSSSK